MIYPTLNLKVQSMRGIIQLPGGGCRNTYVLMASICPLQLPKLFSHNATLSTPNGSALSGTLSPLEPSIQSTLNPDSELISASASLLSLLSLRPIARTFSKPSVELRILDGLEDEGCVKSSDCIFMLVVVWVRGGEEECGVLYRV